MIDLHSHILPGIDDGARSVGVSLEIARVAVAVAVADGISTIAATPHVRDDYPTRPEQMEESVARLCSELEAAEIRLDLRTGAEVAMDRLSALDEQELRRFGLAGGPYLLVECPYVGWPLDAAERLFRVRLVGMTPVLAHSERNDDVQANPELLRALVDAGALAQVTAASIDGRLGSATRRTATELLKRGPGPRDRQRRPLPGSAPRGPLPRRERSGRSAARTLADR